MNSKHTSEEKQNIITAYKAGKRVSLLVTETGIPRSTIYAWLTDERAENSEKGTSFTLREYRSLENKVNRLKGIIDILQKAPCTATAPLEDRLHVLDDLHDQYSVHMLCDALCVPRGTFYNYLLRSKRGCAVSVRARKSNMIVKQSGVRIILTSNSQQRDRMRSGSAM